MSVKKYIPLTVAVILAGCATNDGLPNFNRTEKVTGTTVENTLFIGFPTHLVYYKDQLYISDCRGDTLLIGFDVSTNRTVSKTIRKGQGPEEALPPLMIEVAGDSLMLFNKPVFQLGYCRLTADSASFANTVRFPYSIPDAVANLTCLHADTYLASGFFEQGRYAIINSQGEIEKTFGNYPDFYAEEKNYPWQGKAMFHQVRFSTNRNLRKVACAGNHVLEIVDFSKAVGVTKSVRLDYYQYQCTVKNHIAAERSSNTSRGVISVTSTDRFIYLLFCPAKNEKEENVINEIWVFDWDGKPVKKIYVDQNIMLITAVNDSLLYALTDPEFNIIKLSMQE